MAKGTVIRPGILTKEAITDPAVLQRIDRAARNRGGSYWSTYVIFRVTGMHLQSLVELNEGAVQGDLLRWRRPKTDLICRARLTPELALAVSMRLKAGPKSGWSYWREVRAVGVDAGVPSLSPLTFRHTRAVELIRKGVHPLAICGVMGCSMRTLERHYGVLPDDQLLRALE
jgi:integrase